MKREKYNSNITQLLQILKKKFKQYMTPKINVLKAHPGILNIAANKVEQVGF